MKNRQTCVQLSHLTFSCENGNGLSFPDKKMLNSPAPGALQVREPEARVFNIFLFGKGKSISFPARKC